MAAKQIHELPAANILDTGDQILVSTTGTNRTRRASLAALPFAPVVGRPQRTIAAKLGEQISVRDYGAVGDGTTDDVAAFEAALADHRRVHVPPGTYRLSREVQVKPRRALIGAGRDNAIILAEGDRAFTFNRNEGAYRVDTTATTDWNRSSLSGVTIRMAKGGIRVWGHEFRCKDLLFAGGSAPLGEADPDGWCIDLVDANECVIKEMQGGYGGGSAHVLNANGIRYRAFNDANYGDSLIQEVSLKLWSPNTTAVYLKGNDSYTPKRLVNNVLIQRVQVNAPAGGAGQTALAGTRGIKLEGACRVVAMLCDVEVVDIAFEERGLGAGGGTGANTNNSFIGCFVHYPGTAAYQDSNSQPGLDRSVIRTSFLGCDNFGPIMPGNGSGDGGRAQDGDAFLQGVWICDQYRQPSIQFRSRDKDVLLITSDQKGAQQVNADGHPSQDKPYRGLLIEHSSKQSAKLTRPIANGALDPDDGVTPLTDVRLEFGNGEGDTRGELARVQVNDPLALKARNTQPVRPIDGLLWYATSSAALPSTGEFWLGNGIYARLNNGDAVPVAVSRGAVPERERNLAVAISGADFGKIHRINNAAEITVTVPAGLVTAGQGARRFWVIRQGSGGVRFAVSGGAVLRSPGGRVTIAKQFQMVEVVVTSANDVYLLGIYPDADLTPTYAKRHRERNASYTVTTAHLGELHRCNHGTLGIVVTVPYGLWPTETTEDVVELEIVRVGTAPVTIRADAGTTGTAPMQLRVPTTAAGVTQYNRADNQPFYQYDLALWESRQVTIRKTDATTGEVFIHGLR
ncbi:MAG: glycosyl hydrolase family 28-related protein [Geminicoccaceae bacterium]